MNLELESQVRTRAYLIWEEQGRPHGRDCEHWLIAEGEFVAPEKLEAKIVKAKKAAAPKAAAKTVKAKPAAQKVVAAKPARRAPSVTLN